MLDTQPGPLFNFMNLPPRIVKRIGNMLDLTEAEVLDLIEQFKKRTENENQKEKGETAYPKANGGGSAEGWDGRAGRPEGENAATLT